VSGALAAACALLVAAAARELWAERGERTRGRAGRALRRLEERVREGPVAAPVRGRLQMKLRRAGLEGRVGPGTIFASRLAIAVLALPAALAAAPVAPGRASLLVAAGVPIGAALFPDLLLERGVRLRRRRIAATLPDSLELMAVGAAAGRGPGALLREAARAADGPLQEELAAAVSALDCGRPQSLTLRELGHYGGAELAALAALLDRSRRLGAPLADGLQAQAASLREGRARQIGEHGAKAAPKIQLVVALLLVPSVLLILSAAILANADALFSGL
jgi:tight adherence protein C